MPNFSSATPCFSHECGLCVSCCGGDKSSLSHSERRAKDLSIMMGKKNVEEYRKFYNNRLNTWCKNRGYRDPSDYGWSQEKVKKIRTYDTNDIFILSTERHNKVCDDPYCKMLYHSGTEWDQKKKFPNYPIYTYHNLSLCPICLDRY